MLFERAIRDHVNRFPGVSGSFNKMPGTWHYDPGTNVGVFVSPDGAFETVFKLDPRGQLIYFPHIGGHG